jgi:hypothetical protein
MTPPSGLCSPLGLHVMLEALQILAVKTAANTEAVSA